MGRISTTAHQCHIMEGADTMGCDFALHSTALVNSQGNWSAI